MTTTKYPTLAGKIGSDDLWLWYGRKYWVRDLRFIDEHEQSFLPDYLFVRLTRFVMQESICRGYRSKEEALLDMQEALAAWETRYFDCCDL